MYVSVDSCATGQHTEVAMLSSTLSSMDSVDASLSVTISRSGVGLSVTCSLVISSVNETVTRLFYLLVSVSVCGTIDLHAHGRTSRRARLVFQPSPSRRRDSSVGTIVNHSCTFGTSMWNITSWFLQTGTAKSHVSRSFTLVTCDLLAWCGGDICG